MLNDLAIVLLAIIILILLVNGKRKWGHRKPGQAIQPQHNPPKVLANPERPPLSKNGRKREQHQIEHSSDE